MPTDDPRATVQIPAPPWRSARDARRPVEPRPPLSREAIVDAGIAVLLRDGIDALSMRQVAGELGTGPASLYAHVANKDDLLDLIYDRAFDGVQVPEPDPERWREQVRALALTMVERLVAYNGIAIVGLANVPSGANSLRIAEGLLRILLAGGVPPADAGIFLDRVSMMAVCDAYEASIYQARQRASGKDPGTFLADYFGQIRQFIGALPAEHFPTLRGMVSEVVDPDGDQRYEFGIDLMIEGLAARAARAAAPSEPS